MDPYVILYIGEYKIKTSTKKEAKPENYQFEMNYLHFLLNNIKY